MSLPAQLRDALVNGDYSKIPPQWRDLISRYMKYLDSQEAEQNKNR